MKRHIIHISTFIIYCNLLACRAAIMDKPNIVVILVDDLGWADLGCYGNTFHQTPNIDKLAQSSKQFMQAYAAPVCSPSRAALMTGKSPATIQLTEHLRKKPFKVKEGQWQPPEIVKDMPLEHITIGPLRQKKGQSHVAS